MSSGLPDTPQGRLPQLDGLRGVAVLLVLVEHFTYNEWLRGWSPGAAGVRIFFVLSGFLITGILLSDRDRFAPGQIARRFFQNRALRLLPAFLVAVALSAALGIADMRQDVLWHLGYLSNLQIFLDRGWSGAGHFWTLAVEQQFYLIWFPIVVLLPRRWLLPALLAFIAGGPLFRALIPLGGTEFLNVLFPAQADALALGGLLAVALRSAPGRAVLTGFGARGVWLVLVAVTLGLAAPFVPKGATLAWVVQPSLIALTAACLIASALTRPMALPLLLTPALRWLGKVSYGLYLFHYLVPQALNLHVPLAASLTEGPAKLLRLALWLALSLALAAASWRWIEQPFLRRKQGVIWRKGPNPIAAPLRDPITDPRQPKNTAAT